VLFSTSGVWQYAKKFTVVQDERQMYRTLHSHFFGADKVNTMVKHILSFLSLNSIFYHGDCKNFNFSNIGHFKKGDDYMQHE